MESIYSNPITPVATDIKVAAPATQTTQPTLSKIPPSETANSEQINKPTGIKANFSEFVDKIIKPTGYLLFGAGASATMAFLPLAVSGGAIGHGIGKLLALTKDKDIKESIIDKSRLAGAVIGSFGGVALMKIGISLIEMKKNKNNKTVNDLKDEKPIAKKEQREEIRSIQNKSLDEWTHEAKSDPQKVIENLYKLDSSTNPEEKLTDKELSHLLNHFSESLTADEFGKLVSLALKQEINKSTATGNLLRLTTTLEGKFFQKFKETHLLPLLKESPEFQQLIAATKENKPLTTTDTSGNKQINGEESIKAADESVKAYLAAISKLMTSDKPEVNAFKEILMNLQRDVETKFPASSEKQEMSAAEKAVTSFLFLRLSNPYLVQQGANMMPLTKIVQNLANGVEFGDKEKYMVGFNPVLQNNKTEMQALITQEWA